EGGRDRATGRRTGQCGARRATPRLARAEAVASGTGQRGDEPQQDVPGPRHGRGTAIADRGAARLTLLRSGAPRGVRSTPATITAYGTNPIPIPSAIAGHVGSTGVATHHTAAGTDAATSGASQLAAR